MQPRILERESDKHRDILKELRVLPGDRLFSINQLQNSGHFSTVVQHRQREDVVCSIFQQLVELSIESGVRISIRDIQGLAGFGNESGDAFIQRHGNREVIHTLSDERMKKIPLTIQYEGGDTIDRNLIANDFQNDRCELLEVECGLQQP